MAITLTGSPSGNHTTGAMNLTVSHANAGDYLVVGLYVAGLVGAYTQLSCTYNSVAMTRYNQIGYDDGGSWRRSVTMWGLAAPASGTYDIYIETTSESTPMIAIAQSFSGVHQTTPPNAPSGGTYTSGASYVTSPRGLDVVSSAGNLIVDCVGLYDKPDTSYAVAGDNTLIDFYDPWVRIAGMSYAAGAANVNMDWQWTTNTDIVTLAAIELLPVGVVAGTMWL